jgi:hypothetical protein
MAAMKTMSPLRIAVAVTWLAGAGAHAADVAPPPPPVPPPLLDAQLEASAADDKAAHEPIVKRTVIDDKHNHIEELRVRGQLQKVTVQPKDGSPSYEIVTGAGSHDLPTAASNSRGATGQRVWNLLHF